MPSSWRDLLTARLLFLPMEDRGGSFCFRLRNAGRSESGAEKRAESCKSERRRIRQERNNEESQRLAGINLKSNFTQGPVKNK